MILDVKIPRWCAALVLVLWVISLAESLIAQAVSVAANVKYLQSERLDPPPPWPGEPALKGPEQEKDEAGKRRPRRKER